MFFFTNHMYFIFETFQIIFPTAEVIDFYSCEVVSSSDTRKNKSIKLRLLRIRNDLCFETLNSLHTSSCKMFTFCDVLHETKQNM